MEQNTASKLGHFRTKSHIFGQKFRKFRENFDAAHFERIQANFKKSYVFDKIQTIYIFKKHVFLGRKLVLSDQK